nr:cystathionine beta-lyase [Acetobacter estunensis]
MLSTLFRKAVGKRLCHWSLHGLMAVAMGSGLIVGAAHAADAVPGATTLDHTQVEYVSHCGGCHGIEGISGNTFVPTMRNAVGAFACTDEGRAYLIRVPGVSMSLIRNDQTLADVMNFVMLRLAGSSLPSDFHPYTASEIHDLRQHPLSVPGFMQQRSEVLGRALAACSSKKSGKEG